MLLGNAQGKGQRYPEVDKNRDYLLAQLWGDSTPVDITIPPPEEGMNSFIKNDTVAVVFFVTATCM